MQGKQGSKDSSEKRVNFDNERESKFEKDMEEKEKKGRGRRGRRGKGGKQGSESRSDKSDKSNDPNWYASNPELMKAAASLPFSQTTGQNLSFDGLLGPRGTSNDYSTIPGIMAIRWCPTIGGAQNDAINAAKDSTYSYVVHANSRNASYTASDLYMIILAGAQFFTALAHAIRLYGVARLYDQRNSYLPDGLIKAMGFSPNDIRNNLANMWFDLNNFIAQSTQIWIPDTFPFLDRWFWMCSNIYMDAESVKGQYYLYVPRNFLIYDETGLESGGRLAWVNPQGQPLDLSKNTSNAFTINNTSSYTWVQYKTVLQGMLNALVGSEDRGIIMGDILKAYGKERLFAVSPITVDYAVEPVYNKEVLSQIENITSWAAMYYDIRQNPDNEKIETNWGVQTDKTLTPEEQPLTQSILNFHQIENPTPEQIMVATRLKIQGTTPIWSSDGKTINAIVPTAMGTEYVYSFGIVTGGATPAVNNVTQYLADTNVASLYGWFLREAFDWNPWIYVVNGQTITIPSSAAFSKNEVIGAIGDYDYCTIISTDTLLKMHNTALYSEFGVPTI